MELLRLAVAKGAVSLTSNLPRGMRYRFAKLLYDYSSPRNDGIDMVIPYLGCLDMKLRFQVNTKDYISWWVFFSINMNLSPMR